MNHNKFQKDLIKTVKVATSVLQRNGDINSSYNFLLKEGLLGVLDKHAPMKEARLHRSCTSYITADLRSPLKSLDHLYQLFKRSRSPSVLLEYKAARKLVFYEKRRAKAAYFKHRLSGVRDSRELWRISNKMGLTKRKQKLATEFFEEDELAHYYAGLQTRFSSTTSVEIQKLLDSCPIHTDRPTFKFTHTNGEEVLASFKKVLSKYYGSSPDGLSIAYFKNDLHVLAEYFALLFNCCFDAGLHPDDWKISRVVLLCKKPNPQRLSDTSPITNACYFAKCLENIICVQMMTFFQETNCFSQSQFGYRKDFSTQTALLVLLDDIKMALDEGMIALMASVNYSAAFPSLLHLQIHKFCRDSNFEDEAIWFIHVYHTPPFFFILLRTKLQLATSGIRQGSGPGPVLYIGATNHIDSRLFLTKKSYSWTIKISTRLGILLISHLLLKI